MPEIPRIIHQTWKTASLPRQLAELRQTWRKHHPDWELRLWTDAGNRRFIRAKHPWFLPFYDRYPQPIMRADAVRYLILQTYGGMYVDLDFECLRPLDPLLEDCALALGREPPANLDDLIRGQPARAAERELLAKGLLCNAWMASTAEHPFWRHVVDHLVRAHGEADTLDATGPLMLTRACLDFDGRDAIRILPSAALYPASMSETQRRGWRRQWQPPADAFAVHHWHGSWWRRGRVARVARRWSQRGMRVALTLADLGAHRISQAVRALLPARRAEHSTRASVVAPPRLALPGAPLRGQVWAALMKDGDCVARAMVDTEGRPPTAVAPPPLPRISCLLRAAQDGPAERAAAAAFFAQSAPDRELLIIDHSPGGAFGAWARAQDGGMLVKTVDEARWQEHATGELTAVWRPGYSHPDRLRVQAAAMDILSADGCCLQRHFAWFPDDRRLGARPAPCLQTLMTRRAAGRPSPDSLARAAGADAPQDAAQDAALPTTLAALDSPGLFVERHASAAAHSDADAARAQCDEWREGARYAAALDALAAAGVMPAADTVGRVDAPAKESVEGAVAGSAADALAAEAEPESGLAAESVAGAAAESARASATELGLASKSTPETAPPPAPAAPSVSPPSEPPTVLVLVPVKNAEPHLERFLQNLAAFDYPPDKLSVAFLESDSDDATWPRLRAALPALRARYARAEIYKQDFGHATRLPRWAPGVQRRRREILARSRNTLLFRALRDEQWVLWMDVDVVRWPPDALTRLLACGRDIIVPHCVRADGSTFDMNTFKLSEDAAQLDWARYLYDDILLPPVGYGRRYLGEFSGEVEIDGVGGTMLLVRADIHRQGLVFPAYPHRHYIETEGLAQMAQDMGYSCWGLADLEIEHSDA